jgi:hypothetical protein
MIRHLDRSFGFVTAVILSLVTLAPDPAMAAAMPSRAVMTRVDVWYSPGLHNSLAANQTVYVNTPWWVNVAAGAFECSTTNQGQGVGQAHMDVESASMSFYGGSVVPETLRSGHGTFDSYSTLSLSGPLRVVYPTHTVTYAGTAYADFYPITGSSYSRIATNMQIHVPPTTVTLYAGNDTLTCPLVKADVDLAGAPTSADSTDRVTGFTGPAVVDFS